MSVNTASEGDTPTMLSDAGEEKQLGPCGRRVTVRLPTPLMKSIFHAEPLRFGPDSIALKLA